jgi:hypothetical protein
MITLQADHELEGVLGFPYHVALTLQMAGDGGWLTDMPLPNLYRTYGSIGVTIQDAPGGKILQQVRAAPRLLSFPGQRGGATFRLGPGEGRRMLIEISDFMPSTLGPGAYMAALEYSGQVISLASDPFPFTLRARSSSEQAELDANLPDMTSRGGWGQWTMLRPSDPKKPLILPTSKADPLRYNKIIRYFLSGPQDLKHIPLTCLEVLDGLFAPEAAALKAELLAARDMGAFRNQAFHVRQKYPGLSYWMAEIEARQSTFAWARGNR